MYRISAVNSPGSCGFQVKNASIFGGGGGERFREREIFRRGRSSLNVMDKFLAQPCCFLHKKLNWRNVEKKIYRFLHNEIPEIKMLQNGAFKGKKSETYRIRVEPPRS